MGSLFVVDPIMTKKCSFQYSIKSYILLIKETEEKEKKEKKEEKECKKLLHVP